MIDPDDESKLLTENSEERMPPLNQQIVDPKDLRGVIQKITKREATKAANELGLDKVAVPKLDAATVIGRYIEQSGAIRITTGEIMASNTTRDKLIQLCLKGMGENPTMKTVIEVGRFINELLDSKDLSMKVINTAQDKGMIKPADDKPENRLPPRGEAITPIQVNNSTVTISPGK